MSQAEANVNAEELRKKIAEQAEEIKQLKKQKKFGLVWEDKPDAQVLRVRDEAPMLCEDVSKAVVTDKTAVDHILINGDNYHALTALRATHTGKIDVIYIDPPYNTGNKDFIYNDNYLDKEDSYRHSKWLSFMEKRLTLAKELLAETGVIFVSIDDNEQARLKLLMDEVFGPENFIANMIWDSKVTGGHDAANINITHEYVIVYKSSSGTKNVIAKEMSNSSYPLWDSKGLNYKLDSLWTVSHGYTPNCDYPIYVLESGEISPSKPENSTYVEVFPWMCHAAKEKMKGTARWYWSLETFHKQHDELTAKNQNGTYKIYKKVYAGNGVPPKSLFDKIIVGGTSHGKNLLENILGKGSFDNPKSLPLLKSIVAKSLSRDAIILDFFAGSGTTAHAVAELNKEDGGSRQCILITDGGKTEVTGESSKNAKEGAVHIAEEITYERVCRALTGKDWADEKEHEPLGGNLRYFKVEMEPVASGLTELDQRFSLEKYAVEHAKIAVNIFNEVLSKNEFDDETGMFVDYKIFADEVDDCYLIGVNAHDFSLTDLEEWSKSLPEAASVIMVGSGLEEIDWVRKNSDRISVDDVLGRVIRSRKYVASKLPLG